MFSDVAYFLAQAHVFAILGALVCLAGGLFLICGVAAGIRGRAYLAPGASVCLSSAFRMANGAANGLALGLAGGLLGGVLLTLSQVAGGPLRFTLTGGIGAGLAFGVGCGALVGFALGRLGRLPWGLALGTLAGLAVGLGVFRLIFGAGAGLGPELDQGVGLEIGLLFGMLGALGGGLIGMLLGLVIHVTSPAADALPTAAPADAPPAPVGKHWRWVVLGVGAGAFLGVLVALIGWKTGEFLLILPRYAQAPDIWRPVTPTDHKLGILYGFGVFGATGALMGGLVGALAASQRRRWLHWATLGIGVIAGMLMGLSMGLGHADIGGPLLGLGRQQPAIFDPVGSLLGIVGGVLGGLLVGVAGAIALRWSEREPAHRMWAFAFVLLALGGLVALLPVWFHPLVGLDIL